MRKVCHPPLRSIHFHGRIRIRPGPNGRRRVAPGAGQQVGAPTLDDQLQFASVSKPSRKGASGSAAKRSSSLTVSHFTQSRARRR